MARSAIGVRCAALLVGRSRIKIRGVARGMLVRVVPEVVCLRPCFMPAVASRRGPGELQRHQHQQEKDQIATHKRTDYRGNSAGRTRQGQIVFTWDHSTNWQVPLCIISSLANQHRGASQHELKARMGVNQREPLRGKPGRHTM